MPTPRYTYFIAHATADRDRARTLYDLLHPQIPCFLDVVDLLPGAAWDKELREGQAASRATVVLISAPTPQHPHYRDAEIADAIAFWRRNEAAHRVVPVYLDGIPSDPTHVPYGLTNIHAIDAKAIGLPAVAAELRGLAAKLAEAVSLAHTDAHAAHAPAKPDTWLADCLERFSLLRVPGLTDDVWFEADELRVPLQLQAHRHGWDPEERQPRPLEQGEPQTMEGDYRDAFRVVEQRSLCHGLAIIGDPGSGKTTLLQQIFCETRRQGSSSLGLPRPWDSRPASLRCSCAAAPSRGSSAPSGASPR